MGDVVTIGFPEKQGSRQQYEITECTDKRFREVTGSSILEETRRVRFDCARELLSSSDTTLQEVSSRSGWQSLPTFCREFKRITGMTPEAWRNACR